MNVSAACPQCGATANPNDRFCNTCGNPLQRAGGQAPAAPSTGQGAPPPPVASPYSPPQPPAAPQYGQPGYPPQAAGQPPTQQAQYAPPPGRPQRCQLGHDIMPGMSYCAQGHPIALDAMQFAGDPHAQGAPVQQHAPPVYAPPAPYPQQPYPPPGAQPYPPQGGQPYPQGGQPYPPQGGQPYPAPAQGLGFGAPPQPYPPPQAYGAPGPGYPPQPVFQGAAVPPQLYAQQPPQAPQPGFAPEPSPSVPKTLRGFVVSFQSNPAGDFWPVSTGRTTVGRANAPEPADIPLADATISSRHAAFNIDINAVMVEDTNSTNGTYVNEEHIGQNGKRELRDGDRVRFGGYTTTIKILGRLG